MGLVVVLGRGRGGPGGRGPELDSGHWLGLWRGVVKPLLLTELGELSALGVRPQVTTTSLGHSGEWGHDL